MPTTSSQIVVTPQYYGIHIYSDAEIDKAVGLQKQFKTFWNEKAHEICTDKTIRARLQSKAAIQGTIYTSWTLHKTHILQLQAEELQEEAKMVYRDQVAREADFTTIKNNLERMQQAYASTTLTAESMKSLSNEIEKQVKEKDLDREMTDLKRAQDSLHKALERRRAELLATTKDIEEEQLQAYRAKSPIQLSDNEMEELIDIVRNEEK